jgi:hypothetical protein
MSFERNVGRKEGMILIEAGKNKKPPSHKARWFSLQIHPSFYFWPFRQLHPER